MTPEEKAVEELSRTAAMTFVMARAFRLWNDKLESQARRLHQVHTHETRAALRAIEDGCKRTTFGLKHFEEWALDSGITESGHCGDEQALDSYLTDGAFVAYMAGAAFNATKYDPFVRIQIESLCKNKTKGKPLISWETLQGLLPQ